MLAFYSRKDVSASNFVHSAEEREYECVAKLILGYCHWPATLERCKVAGSESKRNGAGKSVGHVHLHRCTWACHAWTAIGSKPRNGCTKLRLLTLASWTPHLSGMRRDECLSTRACCLGRKHFTEAQSLEVLCLNLDVSAIYNELFKYAYYLNGRLNFVPYMYLVAVMCYNYSWS